MTTKGEWFYNGQGHILSTHLRDDGRYTPILTLAIGPDTDANGEFIVLAVRHLRDLLAMGVELATATKGNNDARLP